MNKILCATRGGEASLRAQDAVIARAKEQGAVVLFLFVADVEFLRRTSHGTRPDVVQHEIERMGSFLLAMACERAASQGVQASPVLRQGNLADALQQVALEEEVTLIALGRPAEQGVFQLAGLEKLLQGIEAATGIPTAII